MLSPRIAGPVLAAVATIAMTVGGASWAGAASSTPKIVATSHNLMVNTFTHLVGTNFAPDSTLTVVDCEQRKWNEPQDPCEEASTITVTTDASGHFAHKMKVGFCNGPHPKTEVAGGTEVKCWIGDEVANGAARTLVGATRITVTGP